MKNLFFLIALVFAFGLSAVTTNAEAAKRLGSGKSMGTQRQATQDKAPAAASPSVAAAPAAGAAPASPSRSWMGPVAGLAAGLGLAALASHLGFGEELASMVMMGLLAAAIMVAIGFVLRKRAAAQRLAASPKSGMAAPAGMQYAHQSAGHANNMARNNMQAYKVSMPANGGSMIGSGLGISGGAVSANTIPSDFDKAAFERNAKVNFIRLQAANDAADLDDIRQFTTPEMFAELKMELSERGAAIQKSDVVRIDAEVTAVEESADRYAVSVRFTGAIRDDVSALEEAFDEVWHLTKTRHGASGWLLSGIQQTV